MDTPRIAWSPDLEIGHPLVDQQHRKLFDLAAALTADGNLVRVMTMLGSLSDYVVVHFRDEEKLMAESGYPGLAEHRRMHKAFRERLAAVYKNAGTLGLDGVATEVRSMVGDWLAGHIMVADREYAAYMAARSAI